MKDRNPEAKGHFRVHGVVLLLIWQQQQVV